MRHHLRHLARIKENGFEVLLSIFWRGLLCVVDKLKYLIIPHRSSLEILFMSDQYRTSLANIAIYIAKTHPDLYSQIIFNHKVSLSNAVAEFHGFKVGHGPFKGLKLLKTTYWAPTDKASMVLGLYEQGILNELNLLKGKYKVLIDIGAADGYYAIGALIGGICEKAYCFELNEEGQSSIRQTAILNDVSSNVTIFGGANNTFYNLIPEFDRNPSILLVDIEGAEFDLLTEDVFSIFKQSIVFIELHDWFYKDRNEKIKSLFARFSKTHTAYEISYGSRNPDDFPELADLCDDDRWLLCSEGRAKTMKWLKLVPIL